MLCSCGKTLSELIGGMEDAFPCSGEINRKVTDSKAVLAKLKKKYKDGKADTLDGLSMEFSDWRFNLRASNTEPVIRLNVETRGNKKLLEEKTQELLKEIGGEPA
jgi:phosphomannomutase